MDQSKADEGADPIRVAALQMAMAAHAHVGFGGPEGLIDTIRHIYLFLIGWDPVVDRGFVDGVSQGSNEGFELYYLEHFRNLKADPGDETN